MPSPFWLKLAAPAIALVVCLALIEAWRVDRRDRAQLASELAATKQLLAAADARQHDRDTQLHQTLAALAAEKRTIVTPAQVIRELPREIPLPTPIVLQSAPATAATSSSTNSPTPAQAQAIIPAEDLKPLYDFAIDCKACKAKLTAAQGDLQDEKTKTTALAKERDHALQIARGGTAWRRITRAAKWFLVGAAAGAIAAKAAH